jgi:hypothetical protein
MKLQAGNWVEVRSKDEILSTLDKMGRLDGLPFMPEMLRYCGQRFRVYKRAHKTCDTVSGNCVGRRLTNTVHLELRCDGQAHGGCQAGCLIFWKQAWLRPVSGPKSAADSLPSLDLRPNDDLVRETSCTEADVWTATQARDQQNTNEKRYFCQATQLLNFTTPLPWWDVRQYLEDYTSGNATLSRLFQGFAYAGYFFGSLAHKRRLGRPARWLYDRLQVLWGGPLFPRRPGAVPSGRLTPTLTLKLQPGELVRVKSYKEILASLDGASRNQGLGFDAELVPYCGGKYRVKAQVNNFIDEKTGVMKTLKTPAVILEGVWCQSRYSSCRMFCPRSIYSWWREIWLERIPEDTEIEERRGVKN